MNDIQYDLIIIGAGPCGLACGIEAAQKGNNYLILEKGNITESVRRYPINMQFFSTSENIEVGGLPLISQDIRPTRTEALKYYRRVALHYKLNTQTFTTVNKIVKEGTSKGFRLVTSKGDFRCRYVIIATGYYDLPRMLNIPGEELPHVTHYYDEAYRYSGTKTVVVGGANSAVEIALDLYRNHADVTLVHQFGELDKTAKYWIRPDLDNRIKKQEVKACFNSIVEEIKSGSIRIRHLPSDTVQRLEADFVFLMTGYRPDVDFITSAGIKVHGDAAIPQLNPQTFETNVEGIYMAGSVVGGEETAKIFIENGKLHAKPIIEDIRHKL
ncbi:FAD-dependent pyridine nucleotide-disulfide oxidoreductase [Flammeovirgaceae bacterium 311]|nr:FAD-dependent pyridine nucleotide-disulfide oxidoreductase [Flammeovirgaceae bacterium 311]